MKSSLDRVFDVLESVASSSGGVTLAELVVNLGLPKTTVFRIASLLESRGYLALDKGRYVLGLKLAWLGRMALDTIGLPHNIRQAMQALAALSGETVHLSVRDSLEAVCIERVEGTNSVRLFMQVGKRAPLYKGSSAKVLLAYADPAVVETVLSHLPPSENRDLILGQITEIRRNGYAVTHGDLDKYAIGIAAPIVDHKGIVVAALSLAGLESRLGGNRLEQSIAEVCECARAISSGLANSAFAERRR